MSRNIISPLTREIGKNLILSLGLERSVPGSLFLSGDYHSLVHAEANPSVCSREEYLAYELFSKFPFALQGVDRKAAALEKFRSVEVSLIASDLKRRTLSSGHHDPEFHWVFHQMKRNIERCLGPFSWDRVESYFGFGPGASIDVKRCVSQKPNKYGKLKPSVTVGCLDLAVAAIRSHAVWRDFHTSLSGTDPEQWFTIVPGNKVVTVPKNSKTDRVIAIEPLMNMYVQKGIGGAIRRRLLRVGVDLNDQSRNQSLARRGSIDGSLSTVDLSSASDSISLELVRELLPPDWTEAIELSRSPRGVLPSGEDVFYRKVSSMGNGFTFELESLIFWSLCSAVCSLLELEDQTIGIYGDDLIVPTGASELLLRCLPYLGFTPNAKKTHTDGAFRESCGKHYSRGSDVSPFYIRENVDSPDRLILLANLVKVWGLSPVSYGVDERLKAVWDSIVNAIPEVHRHYGPLTFNGQLSDSCVGVDFDFACPSRARHGYEGFRFPRLSRRRIVRRFDHLGTLICALDDRTPREGGEYSSQSVETGRWRKSFSVTPQWPDYGPWLPTTAIDA